MSGPDRQERIVTIEKAFHAEKLLSVRTGILHVTCCRITTQRGKTRKPSKRWVFCKLTPGQLEVRVVYSSSNLRSFN